MPAQIFNHHAVGLNNLLSLRNKARKFIDSLTLERINIDRKYYRTVILKMLYLIDGFD